MYLTDDIYCEMGYSPIRTRIVISQLLHALIREIQNSVDRKT